MSGMEERYQRQLMASHFDAEKMQILLESRVLIVGLGGVGSAAAIYLALAGVINLGLCDHGLVEESNLHRQILYSSNDLGLRKVDVALQTLTRMQPALRPFTYLMDVTEDLAGLTDPYDLVLDCLDNSPARLAVAHFAYRHHLPVISVGARDWSGFIAAFHSPNTACWACLYDIPARKAAYPPAGIMGPAAGTAGTWAAARAIQFLIQEELLVKAEYLALDLWSSTLETLTLKRRSDCPVCGTSIKE